MPGVLANTGVLHSMKTPFCERCGAEMTFFEVEYRYNEANGDLIAYTEFVCEHKSSWGGQLVANLKLAEVDHK